MELLDNKCGVLFELSLLALYMELFDYESVVLFGLSLQALCTGNCYNECDVIFCCYC